MESLVQGTVPFPKSPNQLYAVANACKRQKEGSCWSPALEDVYLAYLPLAHIFEMAAQAIEMLSWAWQLICLSE